MFLKTSLVILLLTGITLFSCKSPKEFPEKYKGEQIHFGQGGGFTGAVTYFALFDDGRLFQRAAVDSTFGYVDTWNQSFTSQMIASWQTLQLDSISYYQPGDIYYFMQHKINDEPFHRITWGRNGFVTDPKVVKYYNLLYKSTKPRS
jgi:hypothetical protein